MSNLKNNNAQLEALIEQANALPIAITVDATLTQEGQAADAKATGDALEVPYFDITTLTSKDMGEIDSWVIELSADTTQAFREAASKGKVKFRVLAHGGYCDVYPSIQAFDGGCVFSFSYSASHYIEIFLDTTYNCLEIYSDFYPTISIDGTFGAGVQAASYDQSPSAMLIRNSQIVSTDTNPTNNGEICWTYE